MSIRCHRYHGEETLWAHCDICDEEQFGEAIGPAHSFTELKDLMISHGWRSRRDAGGKWYHFCLECWRDIGGGEEL